MAKSWAIPQDAGLSPDELTAQIEALLGSGRRPSSLPSAAARVAAVPKGSGVQMGGKDVASQILAEIERRMKFSDPDEFKSAYEAVEKLPAIKEQRGTLDKIQEAIAAQAAASRGGGGDPTSALSYMANYLTGGRAKYLPPEKTAKEDLIDRALKAQDDRRDLSKTIGDYIAKMRGGYTQTQDTRGNNTTFNINATDPNLKPGHGASAANEWTKWAVPTQRTIGKLTSAEEPLAQLSDMITSGNPTAEREIPITLARAVVGSARIAIQEIALGKGDPGWVPTIKQGMQKLFHGDGEGQSMLTANNREQYAEFIDMLRKAHSEIIDTNKSAALISAAQYPSINQAAASKYVESLTGAYKNKVPKEPKEIMVDVVAPDGSPGKLPKSKLDAAIKRGFKLGSK